MLRLKDVARIELGAYSYEQRVTLDGQPTIAMGVFLQTGANALEVADGTGQDAGAAKKFPQGMGYVIPVDSTRFVTASIKEVKSTLIEAMVLVIAMVFCFAKLARHADSDGGGADFADWHFCRAVAVWVSINTLTLFAMVLAIGIVVDDAIVVLENVERLMAEENSRPSRRRSRPCTKSPAR